MATNEIYKYGHWLDFQLPDHTPGEDTYTGSIRNGDPVLIGDAVGFAQEVGGVEMTWPEPGTPSASRSSVSFTVKRNTANSLEPGWASVALVGAFAYPVEGWDPSAMGSGTAVGITWTPQPGVDDNKPVLTVNAEGDHWLGYIVEQTKLPYPDDWAGTPPPPGAFIPVINIVQNIAPNPNTNPDKPVIGS